MRLWIIFKFSYLDVYGYCFRRGRRGCWHFSIKWGRSPGFPVGLHWGLLDMGRSFGSSKPTLNFGGIECIFTALHKWYLEAVISPLLWWWYKSWISTRLPLSSSQGKEEGRELRGCSGTVRSKWKLKAQLTWGVGWLGWKSWHPAQPYLMPTW